jgi:hypothetical protein
MKIHRPLLYVLASHFLGCVGSINHTPPAFTLRVSEPFSAQLPKHYKAGEYLYGITMGPGAIKAKYPQSRQSGEWKSNPKSKYSEHGWSITVSLRNPSLIQKAYDSAIDGYAAKLDEDYAYMFARFQRHTFSWGKGISYFTQSTQDTGIYVPHNGHLTYEVWGVTNDTNHVVHASFAVTHPALETWGANVREAETIETLKSDKDYKLIEECDKDTFSPSLTEIQTLIDSLRLR